MVIMTMLLLWLRANGEEQDCDGDCDGKYRHVSLLGRRSKTRPCFGVEN